MTGPTTTALSLAPLAIYFFVLAACHRGRTPRVLAGSLDFRLLTLGLGSLVCFGPIGQALVAQADGLSGLAARLALLGSVWFFSLLASPEAARRVLVFGLEPARLDPILREVLRNLTPGPFARTVRGFEDPTSGRAVDLPASGRPGCLVLLCSGRDAEGFAATLARALRENLAGETATRRPIAAWGWFAAGLVLALPPVLQTILPARHDEGVIRAVLRSLGAD